MDNTLQKAINLFEYVLESPNKEEEIEDVREELKMYVDVLTAEELSTLSQHILPKIFEENSPILFSLLKSKENNE